MTDPEIEARLAMLRRSEGMKIETRSSFLSNGLSESVAAHSWRLALWVLVFRDQLSDCDTSRMLELAVVHDLGEALSGDIPAIYNVDQDVKRAQEVNDLAELFAPLPGNVRANLTALWEEYDAAQTAEARWIKAFDKLETILQHNQGQNPQDFDYVFNLTYGLGATDAYPLTQKIRAILDAETQAQAYPS